MIEEFLARVKDLPVMPEVVTRVVNLTEGRMDISFKELEAIIKLDPVLTAKILKIANSSLYARQKEIRNLQMAITLLGFKSIKSLVLLVTAANLFPRMRRTPFYKVFWGHATLCAFLAKSLALRCHRSDFAEEVFIAGLLHEIGQAVLLTAEPEIYLEILEREKSGSAELERLEERAFSTTHKELGAELLAKWNFPDIYVDAAREHGSVNVTSAHKPLVMILSVACLIAEGIERPDVSTEREDLFAALLPHTGLQEGTIRSFADGLDAELKELRLFHECQSAVGVS